MSKRLIELTDVEAGYILMLVTADYKSRCDDYRHAVIHGIDYDDPVIETGDSLVEKLGELKK